ncbi:histidine kinase [uncultured Lacinutrix sp.]|uniref:histidine kinase n=1 Tax=uncultured Lacinutrix sp. TaxID=574032 RepID=UPI00260FE66F|nr:histidine kinase [uncultured Lacinutrix sp.]
MNTNKYYILFLICALSFIKLDAQNDEINDNKVEDIYYTIKGSVKESDTKEPIRNVNIQVNGGKYTSTDREGDFRIEARIGDELMVSHKDFQTVYHTIDSGDRIAIEVQPNYSPVQTKKYKRNNSFNSLIDSAKFYRKKSAEKSVQFITESIKNSTSVKQNAEAFETLADIYMHWKQYDLAITNYRISLNNYNSNDVKLKLAEAYMKNKNFQESLTVYNSLNKSNLSNYQTVELYEGLGDVNRSIKDYNAAIDAYKTSLNIARQSFITPKITDLNSKLAQTYGESGSKGEAKIYFKNSLDLASQENKTRAIKEKITVADFNNSNADYEEEIQLRKEAIPQIQDIETDSIIENESDFTIQKQNYKIGNAYYLQKDYSNAISYLEKSIEEADKREDLDVEKDGKRKLFEVYENAGDFEKAKKAFDDYTETLDALYAKKDQEIIHAKRFAKKLSDNENRIILLKKDRELSESKFEATVERNKRQKITIYSLIGGLLLLLLIAYLMYKYIKQQKTANNLLALKSLRSQMNPHFIFNALNSVNSFIATNDERTANKYLSDFSKLMRAVLENSEEDFIPLQKEIELLELYTKLEHFRFQDKFDYNITVDDTINVDDFQIPPMLLQPYIENAVWHGLRYKKEKGILDISIVKKEKEEIAITIVDNGIGREKSRALKTENQQKQKSKGMGNIKKRVSILNEMYKDKVDVFIDDFQSEGDIGTKVVVTLKRD